MTHRILQIDSSAKREGSTTRALTARIAGHLGGTVTHRDLGAPLPQIDDIWVGANFTPEGERTDAQRAALALSDSLIAEIEAADTLVIGVPIYNFGIPASLKLWVDQIGRAGRTFRYTEAGPVGLLKGKRAVLAVASGGTEVGSNVDFATGYMRHVLGFIGIDDVEIVASDRLMVDADASAAKAQVALDALAA